MDGVETAQVAAGEQAVSRFFCHDGHVARKKTTIYVDEALLRAAKVAAARSGKREYEVFEEALQRHLGFAGAVERIWAGISPDEAPSGGGSGSHRG